MAQAFIKNINGNFSGPATFFRGGGGNTNAPLTTIGFRNKYSTFFHWKPMQVWASTAAPIRVTGVTPSLL